MQCFFAEAASGTFLVWCWLFGLCRCLFFVVLVWVSAICFLSYLEDGFSMCLCPYLERTQSRQPFRLATAGRGGNIFYLYMSKDSQFGNIWVVRNSHADYAFISKYRRDQSSSIPIKDGRHLTD